MLTTLKVKHFTIVDEILLEFGPGMAAFTGETGAGKSITLDALTLCLGGRGDSGVVRTGCKQCDITALFEISKNPLAKAWLVEQSIEDEGEISLRRVITSQGRSKSFINGTPYPLSKMKELGALLINIHGQNQQYHLLKHDVHREQLDAFSMNEALLKSMQEAYHDYSEVKRELEACQTRGMDASHVELLNYQVSELDRLALKDDEFAALASEHKLLSNQKEFIDNAQKWRELLNDEESSIIVKLNTLKNDVSHLNHPKLNLFAELIDNAIIQSEEAYSELASFSDSLDASPEKLLDIDKRMADIFDIARKHKLKPEALSQHHQGLKAELDSLLHRDEQIKALEASLAEKKAYALTVAKKITAVRNKEGLQLAKQITKAIQGLGMPHGQVDVTIEPLDKLCAHGTDKVEYLVSLNQGMAKKPLSKIASGGELSRISLAIQVLTAEKKQYPTLIFDEVDTGIGGVQAASVGQLLRRLGDHTQVFCVTHQAQVAANANTHFLVSKSVKNKMTESAFTVLEGEAKVSELARMLSGVTMTQETLSHAKNLLEQVESLDA